MFRVLCDITRQAQEHVSWFTVKASALPSGNPLEECLDEKISLAFKER
jgi:hypothetical protein